MKQRCNVDKAWIDSTLTNVLRPHQLEAVLFLLKRLVEEDEYKAQSDYSLSIPLTGAILADDMGTGKVNFELMLHSYLFSIRMDDECEY